MPPTHRPKGHVTRSEANRVYDRRRAERAETRSLYGTARWKKIAGHQKKVEPLCRMCAADGVATPMTVCDHVTPHRGDVDAFWAGPFQSLCDHHHNSAKQAEERARR